MTGEKNLSLTEPKEIKRFGLSALTFFSILSGIGILRGKYFTGAVFGSLTVIGFFCLVFPAKAAFLYRTWMAVARRIGNGFTTITLTLVYYLMITPVALIKRIFGSRPLPMSPDLEQESYWRKRSEPAQPLEGFLKRY